MDSRENSRLLSQLMLLSHTLTPRLRRLHRKANIPGFRPGKVPVSFVKSRYLPGILQEESAQLAEKA